jgi:glycosyltransferase involved in cell wall biosynthesis
LVLNRQLEGIAARDIVVRECSRGEGEWMTAEYPRSPVIGSAVDRDARDSGRRVLVIVDSAISDEAGAGGRLRYRALIHALRRRMPTDVLAVEVLLQLMRHGQDCPAFETSPVDLGDPQASVPFGWVYCSRAAAELTTMLRRERYELVLMSDATVYPYAPTIRAAYSGPFVVDLHNAEADLYEEMANHPDWSSAAHLPDPTGAQSMTAVEHMLLKTADLVSVPSPLDRQKMVARHALGTPIAVVPNAVSMVDSPRPETARVPGQCTFTAELNYFPNVLATLEIAREIGPAIRSAVPSIRVVVAGRNPSARLSEACRANGVELAADPADIRPFFERAIQIVPLRLGGGTRLKIIEAFAAGASVVSTAKGIEGIEAEPGTHHLVASTAAEFAAAVAQVVHDPEADLRRRQQAWDLATARYSWAAIEEPVGHLLDTVAA